MFSRLFKRAMPFEEVLAKTKLLLSNQIQYLEQNNKGYEYRLGQKGIYYILCLAEAIANRSIDDKELLTIVSGCFQDEKATMIFNHYVATKRHMSAHIKFKNEMEPIASKDVKNGSSQSSNFLVEHDEYVKIEIAKKFESA